MAAANPLIITPQLNETIDTSSIATALTQNNQTIALAASGGSNWMVLESDVPPPPFSPDQIPGLGLWLDASDSSKVILSTTTTSTIAVRTKGVGQNGNLIQTTAQRYPQISTSFINGYSAFAFTSSINAATSLSNAVMPHNSTGYSIFAVGFLKNPAFQGTSTVQCLLNGTTTNNSNLFFGAVGCNFAVWNGNGTTIRSNVAASPNCNVQTLCLMQASLEVNNIYSAVNSRQLNPILSTVAQTNFTGIQIGSQINNSNAWNGYLAELLFYNYKLPPRLEQRVQSYLTYKWGIPTTTLTTGGNAFVNGPTPFTPFDPYSVGNCMLWFDASDKTTRFQDTGLSIPALKSGDLVLGWKDKSIYRNHARGIGVTRGIHYTSKETTTCDSVYFTGNQENGLVLSNSLLPTGDATYFLCLRMFDITLPFNSVFFQHGGSNAGVPIRRIFFQRNGMNFYFSILSGNSSPPGNVSIQPVQNGNKFIIISFTISSNSTSYGYDVTPGPTTLGTFVYSNGLTGSYTPTGNANIGSNVVAGGLAELLVYSNILSDSSRQQVEGYLAWKYNNLWQSLSNGHISRAVPTYSNSFASNILVSVNQSPGSGRIGNTVVSYNNGLSWVGSSNGFGLQGNDTPYGIATNGSMWVAVGQGNIGSNIRYSYNGINWSNAISGAFAPGVTGRGVAYNGTNLWVAVGEFSSATGSAACIKYSGDGLNWSNGNATQFTSSSRIPLCVRYGGGVWLVGCTGLGTGNLLRSVNGSNWTQLSINIDQRISAVAYSSGLNRWIAVGNNLDSYTSLSNIQVSLNNGDSWRGIASLTGIANNWTLGVAAAASPTMFIYAMDANAEGAGANCLRYSTDGSNWVGIQGVHFGGGFNVGPAGAITYSSTSSRWIAGGVRVDGTSPGLWFSDNGLNWSASLSGYPTSVCQGLAST